MSKRAEEYLHQFDQYGIPITSWTWEDMVECYDDSRKQAEKDLALTWEDIKEIQRLLDVVWSEQDITAPIDEDTIYPEVLKRFKEARK